jgi:predicted enzyme related to lactoylglutathione lyase
MPERTHYAQGTPSWVDLGSPDVDASLAFYGALFGWGSDGATEDPDESGGYRIFTLRGRRVAGVMPAMAPDQPPAWTTYLAADDVDDISAKAIAAGGVVVVPPMDVMEAGRMTCFIDACGAFAGAWQAGEHTGAELVNEPGTVGWNELVTRNTAAAQAFYPAVFGVEAAPWDNEGTQYTVWNVDGRSVGGLLEMNDNWPEGIPSHWMTYFGVADADAAAAQVSELGGTVHVEPFDVPNIGRVAIVTDPQGAAFSIMAFTGQPDE